MPSALWKPEMSPRRRRRPYLPLGCIVPLILLGVAILAYLVIPALAIHTYGPPTEALVVLQRVQYAALLLWHDGKLTKPADRAAGEQDFSISIGEQAASVAARLEQAGLIRSAGAFRNYLIYSGLDTGIQAGEYTLSPALSPMQIAERLQDATPKQVKFIILPGWRMEEIAASLSTSGLDITPEEFLAVALDPRANLDFLPSAASAEGFLFPDEYTLPRGIQAGSFVSPPADHFSPVLPARLHGGFRPPGVS